MSTFRPWTPAAPGGFLYALIRGFFLAVGVTLMRPSIEGADRVPRHGGVLVVSNHVSVADPMILMAAMPRPVTFMAKVELFRRWYARLAARITGGAFPVRRGENDVRAVRAALELIRGGAAVMMFPEGTRHPEGLGAAHPGVSYLATRSGCPVLPVAVMGTESVRSISSLRRRPAFKVRFGEPFTISGDVSDPAAVIREVMTSIAALLPPDRRGVYADAREAVHAS